MADAESAFKEAERYTTWIKNCMLKKRSVCRNTRQLKIITIISCRKRNLPQEILQQDTVID